MTSPIQEAGDSTEWRRSISLRRIRDAPTLHFEHLDFELFVRQEVVSFSAQSGYARFW